MNHKMMGKEEMLNQVRMQHKRMEEKVAEKAAMKLARITWLPSAHGLNFFSITKKTGLFSHCNFLF